jgi:hypothetical protein
MATPERPDLARLRDQYGGWSLAEREAVLDYVAALEAALREIACGRTAWTRSEMIDYAVRALHPEINATMPRPAVHTHGPSDGPGLACPERWVGACRVKGEEA